MNVLLGVVAAVLLAAFLNVALGIVRTQRPDSGSRGTALPPGSGKKVQPMRRSPYRATAIANSGNACSAVKSLLTVKFLDLDGRLPALPVAGCNIGYCNCRYVRHADRRESDEDRRSPNALTSELYGQSGKVDRRASKGGRRKNDFSRRRVPYSLKDAQLQG